MVGSQCLGTRMGWLVLLFLISAPAWAGEATLALQPVHVVDGEEEEAAKLVRVIRKQLEARGFTVLAPEKTEAALKVESEHCLEEASCIERVSRKLRASLLLQFTVAPYAPRVRATGRLLSREGEEWVKAAELSPGEKDRLRIASAAIERALDELGLTEQRATTLSASRVEPSEVQTPAVKEPLQAPPEPSRSPLLRVASYGALGVGAAALVGGVAMAFAAQGSANDFNHHVSNGNARSAPSVRELFLRTEQQRAQSIALLAAGAGLLTAGTVLYFHSSPTPALNAGVSVQRSEFSLTVSGAF